MIRTFSQPAFSDVDMSLRLIPDLSGALRRHNIYKPPAGFVVFRGALESGFSMNHDRPES